MERRSKNSSGVRDGWSCAVVPFATVDSRLLASPLGRGSPGGRECFQMNKKGRLWSKTRARFVAANRFRLVFCRRHHLSLRKLALQCFRPRQDDSATDGYVSALRLAFEFSGAELVLNMDELFRRECRCAGWKLPPCAF
jgi:hypothetical protein